MKRCKSFGLAFGLVFKKCKIEYIYNKMILLCIKICYTINNGRCVKPEIVNLDYNTIKEEMESCENKGGIENFNSYFKLLKNLNENSTAEVIENEVNKIIDFDNDKSKLKGQIKKVEKEISLLSHFLERETDLDVLPTIIANL